jgi:glutamate racemase
MGPGTELVNSGWAAAQEARRRLEEQGMRSARREGGELRCFTTDNPQRFASVARRFGACRIDRVEYVGTDELEARALPAGMSP